MWHAGTIRDNIIFGSEYDAARYASTVRVCSLAQDVAGFQDGDLTEVGDRGITLSGGRKARLSLARAVYADADIYLLDDPLAAVDAVVARSLFENCIKEGMAVYAKPDGCLTQTNVGRRPRIWFISPGQQPSSEIYGNAESSCRC